MNFIGPRLFRTTLDFPANVPPGLYKVQVFELEDFGVRVKLVEPGYCPDTRFVSNTQFRIEEIMGQLRLLQDQTDLATIQVSIHEPGVAPPPKPGERPSLAEAWQEALDGFLGVCYAVVVGLGYLGPIAGLVGLAWLGYRRIATRPAAPAA